MLSRSVTTSLALAFVLLALPCLGAELNCTDGLDDDADGRIDCRDGDCSRDPSCRQSVTRTFSVLRHDPMDNATQWNNSYFVSWPDIPDIPDVWSDTTGTCGGSGDGSIDSRDAVCYLALGVDPGLNVALVLSRWVESSCRWTGTSVSRRADGTIFFSAGFPIVPHEGYFLTMSSGAPGPVLPASTVTLEGWPDPEWTGKTVVIDWCRPALSILQVPYDTLYRNSDEVLCGLEGVAWIGVNGDGDPDTCPDGLFDGSTPISVLE